MAAVLLGPRQAANPAAPGDEVGGGVANGVEGGARGGVARPFAEGRTVRRRRLVRVGPQGLVQAGDLGPDGRALGQVAQVVGVGLSLQQHRRDVLAPQVEIVQWRGRRGADARAEIAH